MSTRRALAVLAAFVVCAGSLVRTGGAAVGATEAAARAPVDAPRAAARTVAALPALPTGWPPTVRARPRRRAGGRRGAAPRGRLPFRYQYLTGGVNTGAGWATWNPNGAFVSFYVARVGAHAHDPGLLVLQLQQSHPAPGMGEDAATARTCARRPRWRAFYNDLALLFRRAAAFRRRRSSSRSSPTCGATSSRLARGDDARTVPAARGLDRRSPRCGGLPETAAGRRAGRRAAARPARAERDPRPTTVSVWGTNTDIGSQDPSTRDDRRGWRARSARFYRSLGARFDVLFTDIARPRRRLQAARARRRRRAPGGTPPTSPASRRYAPGFVAGAAQARSCVWQIPLGNTLMRGDGRHLGPLPGQPRAVAPRRSERAAPRALARRRRRRAALRRRRRAARPAPATRSTTA